MCKKSDLRKLNRYLIKFNSDKLKEKLKDEMIGI